MKFEVLPNMYCTTIGQKFGRLISTYTDAEWVFFILHQSVEKGGEKFWINKRNMMAPILEAVQKAYNFFEARE